MIVAKKFSVITVILITLCVFSFTVFADSTPTPDVTPYPWYTTPPLQPIHVEGAFSAYFIKYSRSNSFVSSSDIDSSGNIYSINGRAISDFISISPTLDKMICYLNAYSSLLTTFRLVAFYDSNYNFISQFTGSFVSFTNIPSNASYFRIGFFTSYNETQLARYFRVLVSPSIEPFTGTVPDSYFWRDYIYTYAYSVSDGKTLLSLYTGSYPVDELFLDFQFSDSFIPCDVVSCSLLTEVKDGGYNNSFYPVDYNNRDDHTQVSYALFNPYYFDSDGSKTFCSRNTSTQRNNPFSPSVRLEEGMFSGFTFVVPLNKPDGLTAQSQVNITLSDFTINYNDVVVDSIDSLSEMDRISSELQLPTPDTGIIFDNLNITVQQMQNTDFYNVDWFGPSGGILMTMLVTVFTFAALGYILFGKKG